MQLSAAAQRVLGSLIEKELATPQGYPLSLNALRAACNQTTGRDPVTDLDEGAVSAAVKELSGQGLVAAAYARRSSTPKYEHRLAGHLEIDEAAVALVGVLLLRGAQTIGELRQRTERMHAFDELGEVQAALEALADHPFGAVVEQLPRQPGQKEVRWRHLLGGEAPAEGDAQGAAPTAVDDRSEELREEVRSLREEVAELRGQVADLREELRRVSRFVGA